jgi:hypothetical protein
MLAQSEAEGLKVENCMFKVRGFGLIKISFFTYDLLCSCKSFHFLVLKMFLLNID